MTTHATMAVPRQPFSPLHSPRLQHLLSSKNRQNGASSLSSNNKLKSSPSPAKTLATVLSSPSKRRLEADDDDDDGENYDSENIDPSSSSKRSKNNDSHPVKLCFPPPSFTLTSTPTAFSSKCSSPAPMPPPSAVPSRLQLTPRRNNAKITMSSPRAPLTAPAGRSPKARRAEAKNRRLSAPFSRIDPPSFSRASSSSSSALPFSLDAALAGTLPPIKSASKTAPVVEAAQVKTVQESMPSDWFFDIYEDAPGEEAANLMEHSTLTLDLSSDDETSAKNMEREDRGKENVAPEDYSYSPSAMATRSLAGNAGRLVDAKTEVRRRKLVKADDMDDGERSPLSDLETEDFFATGLDKDACIVIAGAVEEAATTCTIVRETEEEKEDEPCAVEKVETAATAMMNVPILAVEGEILIWEDA